MTSYTIKAISRFQVLGFLKPGKPKKTWKLICQITDGDTSTVVPFQIVRPGV